MFNVGWTELLIILFLVLLFFGPKRLPELAEAFGKSIARFKKASRDMRDELESRPQQTPSAPEEKKPQG